MKKYLSLIIISMLLLTFIFSVGCNKEPENKLYPYDAVKQNKMEKYTELNKTALSFTQDKIVFIGDSITDIYHVEEAYYPYTTRTGELVFNRGISGDTSDKLLLRLEDNALNIKPEKIVLLIGTNDIGAIPKEDTINNIKSIIEKMKEANVQKIIVESIYPSEAGARNAKTIKEYNEDIKSLCESEQVIYVDLFTLLKDKKDDFNSEYTYDGLHPNGEGYKVITNCLAPILFD